jgi:hypothetical protein
VGTEGTTGKTKGPNRNSCLVLGGGEEELELVEEVEKILAMDSLHRLTPTQKKIVNTLRGEPHTSPPCLSLLILDRVASKLVNEPTANRS